MKTKIITNLIYLFVRALNFTYRYRFIGLENKEKAKTLHPKGTFIYATWHQNLVGGILGHIGEKFTMIVSASKDGEIVAVTCEKLGYYPARGSSTRGGKEALIELVKNMKSGIPAAITVDGPKGPAKKVKAGVIEAARLTNCAILPMFSKYESQWIFHKSWDQFRFPKPFTRITIHIGEPILVPEHITKDEFEKISIVVEDRLNQLETKSS